MSCFSGSDGRLYGLKIPHLSYQYDVRVLTQGGSQGLAEGFCIRADLSLVNDTLFVPVEILDRVFNCDDVVCAVIIDMVYDRSKGCRLSAACCSGDQD